MGGMEGLKLRGIQSTAEVEFDSSSSGLWATNGNRQSG